MSTPAPVLGLGLASVPAAPDVGPAALVPAGIRAVVEGAISPPRSPRSGSSSGSSSPPRTPDRAGAHSPPSLAPEGAAQRSPAQQALDRAIEKARALGGSADKLDLVKPDDELQRLKIETNDAAPDKLGVKAEEIVDRATSQPEPRNAKYGGLYFDLILAVKQATDILSKQGESSEITTLREDLEALHPEHPNRDLDRDRNKLVGLVKKLLLLGCMLPNGELPPRSPQARPATPRTSPSPEAPDSPHHMALITLKDAANSTHIDDVEHQRSQFDAMIRVRLVAAAIVCVGAAVLGIMLHKGFVLVAYVAYEMAKIAYNALGAKVFSRSELRKGTFFVWLVAGRMIQRKFAFQAQVDHPVVGENAERWSAFLANFRKSTYVATIPEGNYDPNPYVFKIDRSVDALVALSDELTPLVDAANAAREEVHFIAGRDETSGIITVTMFTCGYGQNPKTAASPPPSPLAEPNPEAGPLPLVVVPLPEPLVQPPAAPGDAPMALVPVPSEGQVVPSRAPVPHFVGDDYYASTEVHAPAHLRHLLKPPAQNPAE